MKVINDVSIDEKNGISSELECLWAARHLALYTMPISSIAVHISSIAPRDLSVDPTRLPQAGVNRADVRVYGDMEPKSLGEVLACDMRGVCAWPCPERQPEQLDIG
jgi:hypothetical protein